MKIPKEDILVTVNVPKEVQMLCTLFEITPQDLIMCLFADLCSMSGNQGSDERQKAKDWFLRGSIATIHELDWDRPEMIIYEFENIYKRAYPAGDKKKWQAKRNKLLQEWYTCWLSEKEKARSNNVNNP